MPALPIIALSLAGAGLGMEVASLFNQPKTPEPPSPPSPPALPTPATTPALDTTQAQAQADQAAQDKLTQSRRTMLLSGGETMFTGAGGAPLLSGSTTSKTLLGG